MVKRLNLVALIAAGLSIVASDVLAQASVGRWYQVELIVFRHAEAEGAEPEYRGPIKTYPDYSGAIKLSEPPDPEDESAEPALLAASVNTPYQNLPAEKRRMKNVAKRIETSPDYQLLYHIAWRQPAGTRSPQRKVYLNSLPEPEPGEEDEEALVESIELQLDPELAVEHIEGVIQLKISDLLYIDTDLLLFDSQDIPAQLREIRRVKLKELHYFDHAEFGLLVQVIPIRLQLDSQTEVSAAP